VVECTMGQATKNRITDRSLASRLGARSNAKPFRALGDCSGALTKVHQHLGEFLLRHEKIYAGPRG
jgi:hypothetical protein